MRVEINTFGFLKQYLPEAYRTQPAFYFFQQPVTVNRLVFCMLALPSREAIALVNGRYTAPDYILQDGDQVTILPPVDGG
ncbi:MoaD/ThiS family protein [Thermodesulfobacteriota bacterium]